MDRSAVEQVVLAHLPKLSAQLGLHYWDITLSYDPALGSGGEGTTRGECTRMVDYHSAHIALNPEPFADEADVLRTLRHELFHVVLAPWDLYTTAVERLALAEGLGAVLERVQQHAIEQAVSALERMWAGLTDVETEKRAD